MTSKWQSIILNRSCAPPVRVAYIRFASVYRSFEDIKEFGEEIARLED